VTTEADSCEKTNNAERGNDDRYWIAYKPLQNLVELIVVMVCSVGGYRQMAEKPRVLGMRVTRTCRYQLCARSWLRESLRAASQNAAAAP